MSFEVENGSEGLKVVGLEKDEWRTKMLTLDDVLIKKISYNRNYITT